MTLSDTIRNAFVPIHREGFLFIGIFAVVTLVLGLFSYSRLSVEQFPDVAFPVVVVETDYPGASPENVEEEVTRRIEESVNTVSGIKTLSSRSFEGRSLVVVEFDLTVDPKVAAQDVREKIAIIRPTFRDEIKEPKVSRFNPDDFPIASVAVTSPGKSLRELTTLADQLVKKRLENVSGVGQATLVGGVKRLTTGGGDPVVAADEADLGELHEVTACTQSERAQQCQSGECSGGPQQSCSHGASSRCCPLVGSKAELPCDCITHPCEPLA